MKTCAGTEGAPHTKIAFESDPCPLCAEITERQRFEEAVDGVKAQRDTARDERDAKAAEVLALEAAGAAGYADLLSVAKSERDTATAERDQAVSDLSAATAKIDAIKGVVNG